MDVSDLDNILEKMGMGFSDKPSEALAQTPQGNCEQTRHYSSEHGILGF